MMEIYFSSVSPTPLGTVWLAMNQQGLVAVDFGVEEEAFLKRLVERFGGMPQRDDQRLADALAQMKEYLAGERLSFDLPIDWSVLTPFQQKVLRATCAIPRGEVRTYGEIAALVGNPRAARAVGRAEATNPMPLVIPCHRVVGADGALHGYGGHGGLRTKAWLLELEGYPQTSA